MEFAIRTKMGEVDDSLHEQLENYDYNAGLESSSSVPSPEVLLPTDSKPNAVVSYSDSFSSTGRANTEERGTGGDSRRNRRTQEEDDVGIEETSDGWNFEIPNIENDQTTRN